MIAEVFDAFLVGIVKEEANVSECASSHGRRCWTH